MIGLDEQLYMSVLFAPRQQCRAAAPAIVAG
jgi:hypothetical protein